MQFFAAILFFVYAGNWLDRRLGTAPLCLLAGLFVGGGGAFYSSYRRLTATSEANAPDNPQDHDSPPSS
jgi:F0F1-type ATP synthase assembly protein I